MNQENLQIKIRDEEAKGSYSNFIEIKHGKEEFCLDFFNFFPPVGVMIARIIISPGHLKRMIGVLKDNLTKYEEKYGIVEEAKEPKKSNIGF